jgi:hypothetical protein
MLAIDELSDQRRQELADQVHQMQVNGEIWASAPQVKALCRVLQWSIDDLPDDLAPVR